MKHEGDQLKQLWQQVTRECADLMGNGSAIKVFSDQPDYGQFKALVLSAGFNSLSHNPWAENFRLGHYDEKAQLCKSKQISIMQSQDFESIADKLLSLAASDAEEAKSEVDDTLSMRSSGIPLVVSGTSFQRAAVQVFSDEAKTQLETTNNWEAFKASMDQNLQLLADSEKTDPTGFKLQRYVEKDSITNISLQTCFVKIYDTNSSNKDYKYLVPGVQVTPHAITYLTGSTKLGDIASCGHLINLPNSTYNTIKRTMGRVDISTVTSHNGKFQVNYRTANKRYEITDVPTKQYPSGYKLLIKAVYDKVQAGS